MTIYKCEKCKREFKQKIHYTNHINRKNPCKISINSDAESMRFDAESMRSDAEKLENHSNNDKLKCDYCDKLFSSKSVLFRHQRENCKKIKIQETEKEKLFLNLVSKVEKLEKNNKKLYKKLKEKKYNN